MKDKDGFTIPEQTTIEENQNTESSAGCIFAIIIFILTGSLIFFAIDDLAWNNRFAITVFLKADCDFVVPSKYEIVSNGKLYTIRIKGGVLGEEYISGFGKNDFRTYPGFISEPSYAFSECKAKAYLKKYLKSLNPQLKNFKPTDFK